MKKKLAISLILVLSAGLLFAQSPTDLNGTNWLTWTQDQKLQYLRGLTTGLFTSYAFLADHGREGALLLEDHIPWDTTLGQLAAEITYFYRATGKLAAKPAVILFRRDEIDLTPKEPEPNRDRTSPELDIIYRR